MLSTAKGGDAPSTTMRSFVEGLETINRAIALAPDGALNVDDADLKMRSAAELKAELEHGLERTVSDFNPLKLFRERK